MNQADGGGDSHSKSAVSEVRGPRMAALPPSIHHASALTEPGLYLADNGSSA